MKSYLLLLLLVPFSVRGMELKPAPTKSSLKNTAALAVVRANEEAHEQQDVAQTFMEKLAEQQAYQQATLLERFSKAQIRAQKLALDLQKDPTTKTEQFKRSLAEQQKKVLTETGKAILTACGLRFSDDYDNFTFLLNPYVGKPNVDNPIKEQKTRIQFSDQIFEHAIPARTAAALCDAPSYTGLAYAIYEMNEQPGFTHTFATDKNPNSGLARHERGIAEKTQEKASALQQMICDGNQKRYEVTRIKLLAALETYSSVALKGNAATEKDWAAFDKSARMVEDILLDADVLLEESKGSEKYKDILTDTLQNPYLHHALKHADSPFRVDEEELAQPFKQSLFELFPI